MYSQAYWLYYIYIFQLLRRAGCIWLQVDTYSTRSICIVYCCLKFIFTSYTEQQKLYLDSEESRDRRISPLCFSIGLQPLLIQPGGFVFSPSAHAQRTRVYSWSKASFPLYLYRSYAVSIYISTYELCIFSLPTVRYNSFVTSSLSTTTSKSHPARRKVERKKVYNIVQVLRSLQLVGWRVV